MFLLQIIAIKLYKITAPGNCDYLHFILVDSLMMVILHSRNM